MGGEQQHGQRWIARDDLGHQLDAIHVGHGEIGDDGFGIVELGQRLGAGLRGEHAVTAFGEHFAEREQYAGLVVDEEDRAHARASTMAARGAGSGAVDALPGSAIVAIVPLPCVLA